MPWKLILFIVFVVLIVAFMGANLEHKVPVSVIFHTTQPIPVYMIILYSFCAGVLVMLPFTFKRRPKSPKDSDSDKRRKSEKTDTPPQKETDTIIHENPYL